MIDVRSASTSEQVSAICGVTLRELQWWDERGIVCPRIEAHKRLYTPEQVERVRRVKELRKAGVSLQKMRKYLDRWQYASVMRISVPTVIGGILVVPK